ncbi:Periplasmic copper-binding protein (NosD) [uncultured archaeon]|nr:Periplasmic copper-binding protein (NosD) [uncultured archaeon]
MKKGGGQRGLVLRLILIILVLAFTYLFFFTDIFPTGYWIKSGSSPSVFNCSDCQDCNFAIANASAGDIIQLNVSINATSSCINITLKPNIIFDCMNYPINGSSSPIGIFLSSSNNGQIRNCNLTGFSYGIYLSNSLNNTLTNIHTDYNDQGIYLLKSNKSVLTGITSNNNNNGTIIAWSYYNNLTGIISNNNLQNGIYFGTDSDSNNLTNAIANNNSKAGCYIFHSLYLNIVNLTSKDNAYGIEFEYDSNNNTLRDSYLQNNSLGIYMSTGYNGSILNNLIYNNFLNNSNYNFNKFPNYLNTVKTFRTNIIGGIWTGGNYWAAPNGTGYSQVCSDVNSDGLCDSLFNFWGGTTTDYLPLTKNASTCVETWGCSGWGICNISGMQTRTCTDSCGTNASMPNLNQSCTPDTTSANLIYNWCYQEFANVSTSCGGLNTGTYTYSGIWTDTAPTDIISNAYDGNWTTGASILSGGTTGHLKINYTKPANVTSPSLWQTKNGLGTYNLTIPSSCWSYSSTKISFDVEAYAIYPPYHSNWSCYNGTSWVSINEPFDSYPGIYEEAMIWNITVPSTSSTVASSSNGGGGTVPTTTSPSVNNTGSGIGSGVSGTEGIGTTVSNNIVAVSPTQPGIINVNDAQIYLTKITLNVLESVQSASISVTKVNVLDDANLKIGLPSGQFYQSFRINTSGVDHSNIANATIQFKVNKLWLTYQNGTINGVNLYRRTDTSSQWSSLTTTFEKEDNEFYYFNSLTPGFSTFAIFFRTCQGIECTLGNLSSIYPFMIIAIVILIMIVIFIIVRKIIISRKK